MYADEYVSTRADALRARATDPGNDPVADREPNWERRGNWTHTARRSIRLSLTTLVIAIAVIVGFIGFVSLSAASASTGW